MSASDHLGPQFYHATDADLKPGDVLTPRVGMKHPEEQSWRSQRVWMSSDPGNAGAWWGHDQPGVNVYQVAPTKAVRHKPDEYDEDIGADHATDQFHASAARVQRRLPLDEWNDYHRGRS